MKKILAVVCSFMLLSACAGVNRKNEKSQDNVTLTWWVSSLSPC